MKEITVRKDMCKVLTGPGRCGKSGGNYAKKLKRSRRRKTNDSSKFDEAPKYERTSRRSYGWDCKRRGAGFTMGPLTKFCESKVGSIWNDVYAEICAGDDRHHLLPEYVRWTVRLDAKVADCGALVWPDRKIWRRRFSKARSKYTKYKVNGRVGWVPIYRTLYSSCSELFVHPATGILCSTKDTGLPERPLHKCTPAVTDHSFEYRHFTKVNGTWYEYDYLPLPSGIKWGVPVGIQVPETFRIPAYTRVLYGPEDFFFGRTGGNLSTHYLKPNVIVPPNLSAVKAKYGSIRGYCPGTLTQASSKTLRKVGLKNDQP